ncbi:hypothetical protein Tco_0572629 [Tanacetum coccineum]
MSSPPPHTLRLPPPREEESSYTIVPLTLLPNLVMSSASFAVTYTSVYTDSEPGRVFWGADEEPFEDEEDDEEEEEHPALADSSAILVVDPIPSARDTEAFETDDSSPTPRPSQIRIPFA